jgi:hypothetical protein
MVQNAAGQAQHDVGALAHNAAMPMGAANAKSYAGMAIISGLSWAGTNAFSDPVFVTHPVQHPYEGSLPARSHLASLLESELNRICHTSSDANGAFSIFCLTKKLLKAH